MAKIYTDFQPANLMSFAKSFARLNGQPLDKSEIWYSLAEAQAYATTDAAYVGQILAVIDAENNTVSFYGIQNANGELVEVGSGNVDEVISLVEDLEAKIGAEATEDSEATGLYKLLADLTSNVNTKANAEDVYTKDETDLAIESAIAQLDHLKRKIVNSLDEINVNDEDAHLYIYMVPTGLQYEDDKYDEYIVINKTIEKVGSWEVNLDNYATKDDLNEKVNKDENARLMTIAEGEKLAAIEAGAQVNLFDNVSEHFNIDNNQLNLNDLPISKITNLQDLLNKKVNAQDGYTLLSPDDQKKLAALVVGDDNNLEISGKVNADNVDGLAEWLNKNAGNIVGLSEKNLTEELYTKLDESIFISSVDTEQLNVSNGHLSVLAIDKSKVTGLEDALNAKANQVDLVNLSTTVDDLAKSLNNYVSKATYDEDIAEIRDILTWKEMD